VQRWIWRQLRCATPDDWECCSFPATAARALCLRGPLPVPFEMNWRSAGPPTSSDADRLPVPAGRGWPAGDRRRFACSQWQWVSGSYPIGARPAATGLLQGGRLARGGRLPVPKGRHLPRGERPGVLPAGGTHGRWPGPLAGLRDGAADGADGALHRCRADPAFTSSSSASTAGARGSCSAGARMVSYWLQEPLPQWLRQSTPRASVPLQTASRTAMVTRWPCCAASAACRGCRTCSTDGASSRRPLGPALAMAASTASPRRATPPRTRGAGGRPRRSAAARTWR